MNNQFNTCTNRIFTISLKSLLIAFMMLVSMHSFSQIKDSVTLSNRIKKLEDYNANLEKLYEINVAKLDSNIDNRIDSKVKAIDEAKKQLDLLLYIGLPSTIFLIIGFYFMALAKAKKFVYDNIEKVVEHKREEIIKLIETQEYDSRLRKTKKLLVLSPDEDSQEQIKVFITRLMFSDVKYRIVTTYQIFEDYDIFIFNDHYTLFTQELMTEYLDHFEGDHISFVAYTKNKLTYDQRLNFSNSKFTLYHSIISTLKYAEILKLDGTK